MVGAEHVDDPLREAAPDRLAMLRPAHRRVHLQLRPEPRIVVGAERQVMRRRLAARDVLRFGQERDLLARSRCAARAPARAPRARAARGARSSAARRSRRARPDATRGRRERAEALRSSSRASSSLWKAARRRVCFRIASTPSSSATSSLPVEEPMNTLIPAAPGSRSSSGMSATLSCVPPTQKAKSQCMRPLARASLSASASARRRQRIGVRHLEHGGHAAQTRAARDPVSRSSLWVEARLAEMHLAVDDAGQDVQAPCSRSARPPGRGPSSRSRRSARRGRRCRARPRRPG